MKKGASMAEGLVILAVILAIIIAGLKNGKDSPEKTREGANTAPTQEDVVSEQPGIPNISVGTGNAARAYQPSEEYVTITNRGRASQNITGWQLKNGKNRRTYNLGGELRYFAADVATIGQAALFISPSGYNIFHNVVLDPGEKAIITTGSIGNQSPYKIVSFKENICSGYLENLDEYEFTPSLARNCPRPADEPGIERLDTGCRKFVERLSSCSTPEFETRDRDGEICSNCVNGTPLSSACVSFIRERFSYDACIANHVNDESFSGKTWRIFLGRGWEMWAPDYEIVEIFDQFGRLVKSYDY